MDTKLSSGWTASIHTAHARRKTDSHRAADSADADHAAARADRAADSADRAADHADSADADRAARAAPSADHADRAADHAAADHADRAAPSADADSAAAAADRAADSADHKSAAVAHAADTSGGRMGSVETIRFTVPMASLEATSCCRVSGQSIEPS